MSGLFPDAEQLRALFGIELLPWQREALQRVTGAHSRTVPHSAEIGQGEARNPTATRQEPQTVTPLTERTPIFAETIRDLEAARVLSLDVAVGLESAAIVADRVNRLGDLRLARGGIVTRRAFPALESAPVGMVIPRGAVEKLIIRGERGPEAMIPPPVDVDEDKLAGRWVPGVGVDRFEAAPE